MNTENSYIHSDAKVFQLKHKREKSSHIPSSLPFDYEKIDILPSTNLMAVKQQLRNDIKEVQRNHRAKIDSMHGDFLSDNYRMTKNQFYVTENKSITGRSRQSGASQNSSYTAAAADNKPKSSKELHELYRKTNESKGYSDSRPDTTYFPNKLINKIETYGWNPKRSIREEVENARSVALAKYALEIKKERIVRLEETYENEIDAVKNSIQAIENSRNLYKNEFIVKFEHYIRVLREQKDLERAKLSKLIAEKQGLDYEIKQFESRVRKAEDRINVCGDYKNFMVCLKQKIMELPEVSTIQKISEEHKREVFDEPVNEDDNDNEKDNENDYDHSNKDSKADFYLTGTQDKANKEKPTEDSARGTRGKRGWLKPVKKVKKVETVEKKPPPKHVIEMVNFLIFNKPVFNDVEGIIEEMRKLENDNINYIEQYNKMQSLQHEAQITLFKEIEEDKKAEKHLNDQLSGRLLYLKEIKDKNKRLSKELQYLMSGNKDVHMFDDTKDKLENQIEVYKSKKLAKEKKPGLYSRSFYNKTFKTYNICIDFFKENVLKERFFEMNVPTNWKLKQTDYTQIVQLDMLKFIERTLDILCRKYDYYMDNFSDLLKNYEKVIDEDRKDNKNKFLKQEQNLKQDELRKKLEERDNRVYNVGYRKVAKRMKPIDKKKEIVVVEVGDKNDDFNDLIMGFDSDNDL